MATFVVAHGAWSAGWGWKKMHPLMSGRGHRLVTPTYTGLGERGHLARPDIDLDTHIADILGVLKFEDLTNVNLIGHSYGGMVATGVADRARARIAQLIYIDAFAPQDGDSVIDLLPPAARVQRQATPDGMMPPLPMRRIRRRRIAPGAIHCACRSRPTPSSSTSARSGKAGAPPRSIQATIRTSPVRMC
jgi:pimeloyl-ACP methyl ester carboxylesterase